ncbi:MAG: hypothetical protein KAV83_03350 [Desulfobacterales bacterium]|nr:hypothetical protein [Desulfobacterales bacterium]
MKRRLVILCILLVCVPCLATAQNLIPNPRFEIDEHRDGIPDGWEHGTCAVFGIEKSLFACEPPPGQTEKMLKIIGGQDRTGEWACDIQGIEPYTEYELSFTAYRTRAINRVYPKVSLFGKEVVLNSVWFSKRMHRLRLNFRSGPVSGVAKLRFINEHPYPFWFGKPVLKRLEKYRSAQDFFPVGLYGATMQDLERIKRAGFNVITARGRPGDIVRAHEQGLGCLLSMPVSVANLESLKRSLASTGDSITERDFFYVADEPELRSVPAKELSATRKALATLWPNTQAAMAIIRPQFVRHYRGASDIFMMDQYPVPSMPMTWLSDSIDTARGILATNVDEGGRPETVWAVVQAFGGPNHEPAGWPRMPTVKEMRCLTYLAIAHGTTGIFYFTYDGAGKNEIAWEGLSRIVRELRALEPWFIAPKPFQKLPAMVQSAFKVDAEGRPAVHTGFKTMDNECLLLAVNVIDRPVMGLIQGIPTSFPYLDDPFVRRRYVVKQGTVLGEFEPYEVKVLVGVSAERKE